MSIACLHRAVSSGQTFQKYSYLSAASRSRLRWTASSSAMSATMTLLASRVRRWHCAVRIFWLTAVRCVRLNGPHCVRRALWLGNRQSRRRPDSASGATGDPNSARRFLTSAQYAEMRRKRADLDAKLKQMTAAERGRRR